MKKVLIITCFLFPYLIKAQINFNMPPASASLFAEGIISTGLSERDFALSPDGKEIFYTLQSPQGIFQTILHMSKDAKGVWSKPAVASFAGSYSDLEPTFSPDGKKLFFVSNRPLSGTTVKDFDIWVAEKENGRWGDPKNLGVPVNTSEDEFYPAIGKSGNLYYTAAYKSNAVGKEDIWLSKWENGKYQEPVALDTAVNSKLYEFNAFVSPDEDYIIFTSYGRADDKGKGDLYMSMKDDSGNWQPARNLTLLNSERLDYCPFVSFDKKILFFTSERHALKTSYPAAATYESLKKDFTSPLNGGGNIYWISFDKVLEMVK